MKSINKKRYVAPHAEVIVLNLSSEIAESPIISASGGKPGEFEENNNGIVDENNTTVEDAWGGSGI